MTITRTNGTTRVSTQPSQNWPDWDRLAHMLAPYWVDDAGSRQMYLFRYLKIFQILLKDSDVSFSSSSGSVQFSGAPFNLRTSIMQQADGPDPLCHSSYTQRIYNTEVSLCIPLCSTQSSQPEIQAVNHRNSLFLTAPATTWKRNSGNKHYSY